MAPRRAGRADDQQRLAEEIAAGAGPQVPEKRGRGRPRKHPLPDPAAPKRPRGRPPKAKPADPDPAAAPTLTQLLQEAQRELRPVDQVQVLAPRLEPELLDEGGPVDE